jgi:hypothetical protein
MGKAKCEIFGREFRVWDGTVLYIGRIPGLMRALCNACLLELWDANAAKGGDGMCYYRFLFEWMEGLRCFI